MNNKVKHITNDYLKEVLKHDIDTGNFIWVKKTSPKSRVNIGEIAGNLNNDGYRRIKLNGKKYQEHVLVWFYHYGKFPNEFLDHVDGDKANNRLENLRECSQGENNRNRAIASNNTTGFRGVTFCKQNGKFKATAHFNGEKIHLGYYITDLEASDVVEYNTKLLHGEFYKDSRKTDENKTVGHKTE